MSTFSNGSPAIDAARATKWLLLSIALAMLPACKEGRTGSNLKTPAVDQIRNPGYEVVNVGIYNYTHGDVYDVFILDPGSDDIDSGLHAGGSLAASKDATHWPGIGITATLAWDWRWRLPKRFSLVWLNVFDPKTYESVAKYDAYKTQETAAGSAWCRVDVTIDVAPEKGKGNLYLLHFFPDGHVATTRVEEFPVPITDFAKRDGLPSLKGAPCLRTVPNPKFGKQEPKFTE